MVPLYLGVGGTTPVSGLLSVLPTFLTRVKNGSGTASGSHDTVDFLAHAMSFGGQSAAGKHESD